MKIRPLGDHIVVRRLEEESRSRGGIIIPDGAREKPVFGSVLAVGRGRLTGGGRLHPPEVRKSDRVLFSKYAGTEVKVAGEELLILKERDVLAVIDSGLLGADGIV